MGSTKKFVLIPYMTYVRDIEPLRKQNMVNKIMDTPDPFKFAMQDPENAKPACGGEAYVEELRNKDNDKEKPKSKDKHIKKNNDNSSDNITSNGGVGKVQKVATAAKEKQDVSQEVEKVAKEPKLDLTTKGENSTTVVPDNSTAKPRAEKAVEKQASKVVSLKKNQRLIPRLMM